MFLAVHFQLTDNHMFYCSFQFLFRLENKSSMYYTPRYQPYMTVHIDTIESYWEKVYQLIGNHWLLYIAYFVIRYSNTNSMSHIPRCRYCMAGYNYRIEWWLAMKLRLRSLKSYYKSYFVYHLLNNQTNYYTTNRQSCRQEHNYNFDLKQDFLRCNHLVMKKLYFSSVAHWLSKHPNQNRSKKYKLALYKCKTGWSPGCRQYNYSATMRQSFLFAVRWMNKHPNQNMSKRCKQAVRKRTIGSISDFLHYNRLATMI